MATSGPSLDGTNSYDPDSEFLTYAWTIVKAPKRANWTINNGTLEMDTFETDRHGEYIVELTVFDGEWSDTTQLAFSIAKSGGGGGGGGGGSNGGKNCSENDTRPKCNR